MYGRLTKMEYYDNERKAMFKYTEGYLKLDGIKIHYYRTGGKKPPFILLHGATDNGLCWTSLAELLAEQYDVIMPDAQGHGLSDRLDPAFTFKNHTEQVAGLVRELGLKKPFIMGHSLGADTALTVAVEYPSLPRAIILEDPPWGDPPVAEPTVEEKRQWQSRRNWLLGLNRLSLEEIKTEGRKLDPGWTEHDRDFWAKAKQQFDAALFSKPIVNERPYTEIVPRIKCPTLLIIAEQGIVTPAVAAKAAKLWKSKQPFKWVQIKGASHNIRRDKFEEFKKALFGFLETCSEK
jgi:N-formylmaleamate deformylase